MRLSRFVYLFGLAIFVANFCLAQTNDIPVAEKGILDLREWKFSQNKPIDLSGEWEFYWNHLILPEEFDSMSFKARFRQFPKLWEADSTNQDSIQHFGYATHRLRVILSSVTPELSIAIPHFYSSYLLFINGDYVSANGQVGMTPETSAPQWQLFTRDLRVTSDTLDIVLQVSNFQHNRGGSVIPIMLGEKVQMQTRKGREEAFDLIMASSLFFVGLFFMVLFWFGRHEKQIFFYALFCLFYSYRAVGSGNYTFHSLYPELPWLVTLKLEYITMFLSALFFAYYSYHLYKEETHRIFIRICLVICVGCSLATLTLPVWMFTALAGPFSIFILVSFVYMVVTYVMAVIHQREGSMLSLVSSLVIFLVIGMVILEYFGMIKGSLLLYFIGYQQFFFIQSVILFYRYTQKLELAKTKAESAAKARSDFLSMISHEIRTPLNAVIGLTNFLMSDEPKKKHVDDLKTLKFSAENLHVLINDVLDYSKMDAGKIEFELIDTDVISLAQNIVKGLDTKAKEKEIYLNLNYDDEIPNFIICDGLRLSQILTNLIGNAIKFTNEGGVTLTMTKIMLTKKKVSIKFSVEDSGIGIPKDKIETIFDSFEQASSSTTREYGGTGLGLSITKRILDLQNTKLNVFSVVGQGSRFYFTQTFEISEQQQRATETIAEEQNALKGKRILLVEDNPVNVMVAKKFLSRWDILVDVAENGREAIEKKATAEYDLILMDLQMPIMDGYTAASEIRKRDREIPILALTASVMLDVGDRVYGSGMNDFITKPFDPDDLYNKIRIHILKEEVENNS